MCKPNAFRWPLIAAALALSSLATAQDVRISEFHYDNVGTDTGEAIEISAPAGTNLGGWSVVLYNGSGGAPYDTDALSGLVSASCGDRGVFVLNYASNGIQNGAPDGIALVNGTTVVQFLSYEGSFTAVGGPANGLVSTDIGILQNGSPAGESLSRDAFGTWSLGASTFGSCNDSNGPPPADVATIVVAPDFANLNVGASLQLTASAFDLAGDPIPNATLTWESTDPSIATVSSSGLATGVSVGGVVILARSANGIESGAELNVVEAPVSLDLHFNEIHYDNLGSDTGEAIEIEGPAGADLTGFSILLYNGNGGAPYNTRTLSGSLPASCGDRGVLSFAYPADGIQNGSPDGMALVSPTGEVIEFLSYEGVIPALLGPAAGTTSVDIGAEETTSSAAGNSLQRNAANVWSLGASSFGACNTGAPPVSNSIQFSGRVPSDPPLPVGFEDQLFAALRDSNNTSIPTTFTWESLTPDIATIDQDGVIHVLAAGSATFSATAAIDGTTGSWTLPTHVAVASSTAQYANNTEFGEPQDSDPTDDLILERPQFTSSWNPDRGSPNWVAYEIDASHFGAEDRCDCFTMDDMLPSSLPRLDTNDYTGAGAFHGYGIDRGHLARSFDRTSGSLDNATTFYFSNIIPQASDQNQGPWAQLENDLGNFARNEDREVYVLAGAFGNKGTLKNEGKVVIPTHTWKVALILPRDRGLADVHDYRDVQVTAVIMPNEPGVRNVPWQTYLRSVDEVEALTGYDLLALLDDDTEDALESGLQPPIASISGPLGTVLEGGTVSFNATGSVDPNGSIVSYEWDFGDGAGSTEIAASHTYPQDGVYSVTLTVTDNDGLSDSASFSVTVANVAPAIATVPDGSLDVGQTYTVNGAFTDPGADTWTATVVWGDGSAPEVVPLTGRTFTLTHVYTAAGSYPVSIAVADDDGSDLVTHGVTVNESAPALADALPLIDDLVARGKISRPIGMLLKAQVIAAQVLIGRGNEQGGEIVIRSILIQLDLLVRFGVVSPADVAPLRAVLVSAL